VNGIKGIRFSCPAETEEKKELRQYSAEEICSKLEGMRTGF
jgi:hypothetical protein